MYRRAAGSIVAAMIILTFSQVAVGQQVGVSNPALRATTVDAAALGSSGGSFVEYSMGDRFDYNAVAGLGLGAGSLRAAYQHAYRERGYGIGYARALAASDFGVFGRGTLGLDVFGAYMGSSFEGASRGARIAVPFSLRWGSPSFSVAPYVAPYAELGRSSFLYTTCDFCSLQSQTLSTRTGGLAGGLQINAWHLGLNLELRDAGSIRQELQKYQFTTGIRIHF